MSSRTPAPDLAGPLISGVAPVSGGKQGGAPLSHQPTAFSGPIHQTPSATIQSGTATRLGKVCPACLERYPMDFRVCPRDATSLEDAEEGEELDALLGETVGDTFSIVRTVGEGGMARVYEGRHVRLPNKRFAIKVLHHMYAQQPTIVSRFQREAEAASGIGHPNVVDVYDVGTTPDGRPYLVSELLQGQDFAALLDERERLPAAAAVHVVRQVCRALTAAHAHGVVHRDVKPENVFLVGDMEAPVVKVLDFGISKFETSGGASLTQTGMIMGTPGYMAPEQARGGKTDHRADIYGVGAMLYRAVTGKIPFDSEDAAEALTMVLTQDPPRPRKLQPSIPEALELVIQKAMAKDPEDRYRSMAELDEALAPFDAEAVVGSVSLMPPPMSGSAPRPAPKATLAAATVRSPSIAGIERDTREAKLARPMLVLLTFTAYVWLLASVVDAATSALAVIRGTTGASVTEKVVATTTVIAILVTPLVFWLRHLGRVWKNSVHAVELSKTLRRVVLAATVPYAFLALTLRVLTPPADPRLPGLLTAVSVLSAAIAYGAAKVSGRRRRA